MPAIINPSGIVPNGQAAAVKSATTIANDIARLTEAGQDPEIPDKIKQLLQSDVDRLATLGAALEIVSNNPATYKQSTERLLSMATEWFPGQVSATNLILHCWDSMTSQVLCTLLFQIPTSQPLDIQSILKHALQWSKSVGANRAAALDKGDVASALLNQLIAQHLSSTSVTGTDKLPSPTTEFVASVTMNHLPTAIQSVLDADMAYPALALTSYLVAPVQVHRNEHERPTHRHHHHHTHHKGSNVYNHVMDTLAEHCLAQYADGFTKHVPEGFREALREVVRLAEAKGNDGCVKEEAALAVATLKKVDPKFV